MHIHEPFTFHGYSTNELLFEQIYVITRLVHMIPGSKELVCF